MKDTLSLANNNNKIQSIIDASNGLQISKTIKNANFLFWLEDGLYLLQISALFCIKHKRGSWDNWKTAAQHREVERYSG
jgi:hypothetical protein